MWRYKLRWLRQGDCLNEKVDLDLYIEFQFSQGKRKERRGWW